MAEKETRFKMFINLGDCKIILFEKFFALVIEKDLKILLQKHIYKVLSSIRQSPNYTTTILKSHKNMLLSQK